MHHSEQFFYHDDQPARHSGLRYPHLFHGAVSSSAPVLEKADFHEYHEAVEAALRDVDPNCTAATDRAFESFRSVHPYTDTALRALEDPLIRKMHHVVQYGSMQRKRDFCDQMIRNKGSYNGPSTGLSGGHASVWTSGRRGTSESAPSSDSSSRSPN